MPAYHLALAYTGLGDIEKAFELLERACLDRDPVLPSITVEPRFDLLRNDPRYRDAARAAEPLGTSGSRDPWDPGSRNRMKARALYGLTAYAVASVARRPW